MRILTIFLLLLLIVNICFLWFLHSGFFDFSTHKELFNFLNSLTQSFLSGALIGLLFELAVWKFGSSKLSSKLDEAKNKIITAVKDSNQETLDKIPLLSATSLENIDEMSSRDVSALLRRILNINSSNGRVADRVARMASEIIELDDNKVVSNLKHVIKVFEDNGVCKMKDTVSYRTKEGLKSFTFGVFARAEDHEKYVAEVGPLSGYWVSSKAFPVDGVYNGEQVFISDFQILRSDEKHKKFDLSASISPNCCIYVTPDFDINDEVTLMYTINTILSAENPLLSITSPFVSDIMSARVSCANTEFSEILYKVAAPFSGNVQFNKTDIRDIELIINDVIFPGHGFVFSLRRNDENF